MNFMERMATAPISWGICEVPGWGIQLPVDRVLSEMAAMGFPATELGSEGYLPSNPEELLSVLAPHNLSLLAAFVPLVMHDESETERTLRDAEDMAVRLKAMGATYFNTSPVTTWDWAPREELSDAEWAHTMTMFDRVEEIVAAHGLQHVMHEHVGTIVETKDECKRILDGCNVKFVLDTAHLAVGGYDPVDFVNDAADRVGLVHIKDANMAIAAQLNEGEITLMEAVQAGIFPCVGSGDLDIDTVIETLERGGFTGWYVLEQDAAITGDAPVAGAGPLLDMQQSLNYLHALQERLVA